MMKNFILIGISLLFYWGACAENPSLNKPIIKNSSSFLVSNNTAPTAKNIYSNFQENTIYTVEPDSIDFNDSDNHSFAQFILDYIPPNLEIWIQEGSNKIFKSENDTILAQTILDKKLKFKATGQADCFRYKVVDSEGAISSSYFWLLSSPKIALQ